MLDAKRGRHSEPKHRRPDNYVYLAEPRGRFPPGGAGAAEDVEDLAAPLNRRASQGSLPCITSSCRDFAHLDHLRKLKVFVGQRPDIDFGEPMIG
jgi:hypothetical protein